MLSEAVYGYSATFRSQIIVLSLMKRETSLHDQFDGVVVIPPYLHV